jgi:hypothetical protein
MLTSLAFLLLLQQAVNSPTNNGVVEGVLRASTGAPAAGVRVVAKSPQLPGDKPGSGTLASLAQTDGEGRFRLEGVPPGRYLISAGNLDSPTYYPGTVDVLKGTFVTVAPGLTISSVNFTLDERSVGRASVSSALVLSSGVTRPNISVSIQIEGGGRVPVFSDGHFPVLRFTRAGAANASQRPIEMWFTAGTIDFPIPASTDEYTVAVDDLPPGYAVKSITQGVSDLLKETLKVSRPAQATQSISAQGQTVVYLASNANLGLPLALTLSYTPPPVPPGVRVTGKSAGGGDEIYLSGKAGTLYSDGTFEFFGVSPGLHTILKSRGTAVTAAPVLVRDSDVEAPNLESVQILPSDVFSREPAPPDAKAVAPGGLLTIRGRVLDEISQEELQGGAVTVTGYQNFRRVYAIVAGEGFKIPSLLPGTYNIELNVAGYNSTTRAVIVGAEDVSLEIKATRSK